jgi:uncharacterized Ntn-hydrolase superfamily protein
MKKLILLFIIAFAICRLQAQDTFSIVAVDTITGEVGSAGASCIDETAIPGGAIIISDVLPARGGIHTQSYWNATNQLNAHNRMVEGMSPQEIIDWLQAHDSQNNPAVRQYGVVDFDSAGHPRSAGFTGANCLNYKNHITGPNYSIQGNILLGQQILDSIEARFLNTEGSFAEKLMAALQGAKVIGADTRCASYGTSSLSAFIRVARPNDTIGGFYCDLNVPSVPEGMEPIDSLQTLFDAWLETTVGIREKRVNGEIVIYPNPAGEFFTVSSQQSAVSSRSLVRIEMYNLLGMKVDEINPIGSSNNETRIDATQFSEGIYTVIIFLSDGERESRKLIIMNSH